MDLNRNIVIEASAGTGKTYTLVQTILQALFEKNLPMDSVVALTFTKKAAGEMKERIAAELKKIDQAKTMEDAWIRWGHTLQELKGRAREALETIDRAAIGTIHSYGFSLLKRFPLAAGISPDAEVDDKNVRGDDLFEKEWSKWLRSELREQGSGGAGERAKEWLEILEQVKLSEVSDLARRLCDFDVPLESLLLSKGAEGTGEQGGDQIIATLARLIKPFVAKFRARILADGYLSNNALLVLARELVASDFKVREILKREIQMIFVDEFQDTDPLQGELLLFLAEKVGGKAKRWQDVMLQPGKLFIVGDPKQSIYRFRGADIAAYQGITRLVLEQGGERLSLEESYRSHEQIIHLVNAAFKTLIEEKHPISPAYQALIPRRLRKEPAKELVELRLVGPACRPAGSEDPQSSDDALEKEAEDAAAWIATHVRKSLLPSREKVEMRDGVSSLPSQDHPSPESSPLKGEELRFRDIALIFRSTPAMTPFIEKLRARNIPFVVEAERYFYRTPEVTDVLNLLRVIANPKDRIALVGVLRSPIGGFTDKEIVALKESDWELKPSSPIKTFGGDSKKHAAAILDLIHALHERAGHEPLKGILGHVYEDTYLLELAARSYHKDQTIANLLKLKRLMESFAEEGETSLGGLLSKIDRFMEDDRLEGESPLADETYDAVRLLTIHKAKGLEFPVVWLPGLHRGRQANRRGSGVRVHYDWSTARLGISITKDLQNQTYATLDEEGRAREEAEERRVLYVAMTRARDHLILSGGIDLKRPSKDAFLGQLARAWGLDLDAAADGEIAIGDGLLAIHQIIPPSTKAAALPASTAQWLKTLTPAAFAKTWRERAQRCRLAEETPLVMTPTALSARASERESERREVKDSHGRSLPRSLAPLLGTLVHRFLEQWDFSCEKCSMPAKLRVVANHYFASQGLLKEPFPDPKDGDKTNNPRELVELVEEAQRLLADFIGSEAWEEIKGAEILGREVPFFYEMSKGTSEQESKRNINSPAHLLTGSLAPTIMRGTIDILYRLPSGQLVIGDYKTGHLSTEHGAPSTERYAEQGKAYEEGVSRALGEKPIFKLIHLREGSAVAL